MKIIGYRRVEFTAEKTGELVSGFQFYCGEQSKNTVGLYPVKPFFVSDRALAKNDIAITDISANADITVLYNRYGKVDYIRIG